MARLKRHSNEHDVDPYAPSFHGGMGLFKDHRVLSTHHDARKEHTLHHRAPAARVELYGGRRDKKKKLARRKGIHIHPRCRIEATDWVAQIKACNEVPGYLRNALTGANGLISIPDPGHFMIPYGVNEPWWLNGWLEAFWSDKWDLTTAVLDITVTRVAGQKIAKWICKFKPDVEVEEADTYDNIARDRSLKEKGQGTGRDVKVQLGVTLPGGVTLNSGRMLMAVVDRVNMHFGDNYEDDPWLALIGLPKPVESVRAWFHEIAVHAGPFVSGSTAVSDDDPDAQRTADDLERTIPGNDTWVRIRDEIDKFLRTAK